MSALPYPSQIFAPWLTVLFNIPALIETLIWGLTGMISAIMVLSRVYRNILESVLITTITH